MEAPSRPAWRAGIIGLGFIGGGDQISGDRIGQKVKDLDGSHRTALARNPRVDLVCGCDLDPGRRERFASRTGARIYADWRGMLEAERLDLVSIATYAPSHAELAVACAERGVRAVYCEKPIATRLPEAERMLAACEAAGTLLVVNHNRRFSPHHRKLRETVAAGTLGELTSVSLEWSSGRLGCVGTHMFDAACLVIGRRVEAVSATLDLAGRPDCRGPEFRDPGGWGVLRIEGGLMATVDAGDRSRLPGRLAVNGTEGRAVVIGNDVILESWTGRREHWPAPRRDEREPTSMDRAVAEIVAWLEKGGEFSCSPREALHALEVIVGFHASHARNGAWTDLPLAGADREIEVRSG